MQIILRTTMCGMRRTVLSARKDKHDKSCMWILMGDLIKVPRKLRIPPLTIIIGVVTHS